MEVLNALVYHYCARHYDSKAGRFLQSDPIPPRPQEMNRYVYTRNNPVQFTDPFGLLTCFGCKQNDEINMHLSAVEAEDAADTCLSPAMRTAFRTQLDTTTVWCQYSGQGDCADTCEGGSSINVYESGMREVAACGSLASTLFHEVLHQVGGLTENEVRALERKCVRGAP